MSQSTQKTKKRIIQSVIVVGIIFALVFVFAFCKAMAETESATVTTQDPQVTCWAFIAAAIAAGLSSLAAGIAVAYVGAAAIAVVGEKPELAGRALIFVGLAEGIAIYGLIIAIMILMKV